MKKYKAKTIAGAERMVNKLLRERDELLATCEKYDRQRRALAKLSADGAAFDNPLVVYEAKTWRNEILRLMGLKPDGGFYA